MLMPNKITFFLQFGLYLTRYEIFSVKFKAGLLNFLTWMYLMLSAIVHGR